MNTNLRMRLAGATVALLATTVANAQVLEQTFTGSINDNYLLDSNWIGASGSFVPDVDLALEIAAIGSNTPDPIGGATFPVASATLSGSAPDVGRLILGFGADTMGTLTLNGNASLNVKAASSGGSSVAGDVVIGGGSDGSLLAMSGNSVLSADSFNVTEGDTATFADFASVTSRGLAQLLGDTTITGPNVSFNANTNLVFEGTHTAQITSPTAHSVIDATSGSATLAGADLFVDLSAIPTPSVGDSWRLVEAQNVGGLFSSINLVGSTTLGAGIGLAQRAVPTVSGTAVEVSVEAVLSLEVDRATGDLRIRNLADAVGANTVSLDGYTIASPNGLLSTSWDSLDDQGVSDWRESNPTAQRLSELKPTGATPLAGQADLTFVGGFSGAYSGFGQADDLTFSYTLPDGSIQTGPVVYTGPANTLVLQIDPADGEARLVNQSAFSVNIDGYTIESEDDALLTSWDSLDDQNAGGGDWNEANPTAGRLSELKATGALTIAGGASFDLGVLYDGLVGSGDGDVAFSFLVNDGIGGASVATAGEVQFATISGGIPGDFNNDGVVNAADYSVWRDNLGDATEADINGNGDGFGGVNQADFVVWSGNFGTGAGSATSIPEPTAFASLCLALVAGGLNGRRRARR